MVVEDFYDLLYSIDISNWVDSLDSILSILCFPGRFEYACGWREYLYERANKLNCFGNDDRRMMSECKEIAVYSMNGRFHKANLVAVFITGNPRLRNEKAYDIYRLFRKIYGRHVFFVVCFDSDFAFLGTSIDGSGRSEVVISEWFGKKTNRDTLSNILKIDFSLFSYNNLKSFYNDYLWSIARSYIVYHESVMYLLYGCENFLTYESYSTDSEGSFGIPVTKIDREATIRVNAEYYKNIYDYDYYVDDSSSSEDTLDIVDEEDIEFEWTMLEMQLIKEEAESNDDDYANYEENSFEDEVEDEYEYEGIRGMNPEEMLSFIQDNRYMSASQSINDRKRKEISKRVLYEKKDLDYELDIAEKIIPKKKQEQVIDDIADNKALYDSLYDSVCMDEEINAEETIQEDVINYYEAKDEYETFYKSSENKYVEPFLIFAMNFVLFAMKKSSYYKVLFMSGKGNGELYDIVNCGTNKFIIKEIQKLKSSDMNQIEYLFKKVFIFVYGLANLAYTGLLDQEDTELEEFLRSSLNDILPITESNGNKEKFVSWLKDNRFVDKVIDSYMDVLSYYDELATKGGLPSVYTVKNEQEFDTLMNTIGGLRDINIEKKTKKYYCEFLKSNS